ncbi:MAG: aminotransferase class IV [Rikenellaceae bacterium]
MFPFFETIRIKNGEVINLFYHHSRVALTSQIDLNSIVSKLEVPLSGIYKLRISYNDHSVGEIAISEYTPKAIKSLKIVECNSIDYSLKRNDRSEIDLLQSKRGNADDVLIVKNGMITDTSFCNIIFYDGHNWFTPNTPLLRGTCRERLLALNIIAEQEISINDIKSYKSFMLINAMLDFNPIRAISVESIF